MVKKKEISIGYFIMKTQNGFYDSESANDGACNGKFDDCKSDDKFDRVIGLSLSSNFSDLYGFLYLMKAMKIFHSQKHYRPFSLLQKCYCTILNTFENFFML